MKIGRETGAKIEENAPNSILEELSKMQAGENTQTVIENIAKHYRILLNTILRFAVEAAWAVNQGGKGVGYGKKREEIENEETLRLKLMNAELNERLVEAAQENEEQRKRLALFMGEEIAESDN